MSISYSGIGVGVNLNSEKISRILMDASHFLEMNSDNTLITFLTHQSLIYLICFAIIEVIYFFDVLNDWYISLTDGMTFRAKITGKETVQLSFAILSCARYANFYFTLVSAKQLFTDPFIM